jgi:hypothetical protein
MWNLGAHCLHHQWLTPSHSIDLATGEEKMERKLFNKKMAAHRRRNSIQKINQQQ